MMRKKVDYSEQVNRFCESTRKTLSDLSDHYKFLTKDFVEMCDRLKKIRMAD